MAERTRDEIWKTVLAKTVIEDKSVRIADIVEVTNASERTVREVLVVMSKTPFLNRLLDDKGRAIYESPLEYK